MRTAFVMGDVPPATQAQYERIATLIRRGRVILLGGSGVVFVALVLATGRGAAGPGSWLILAGAVVLAVLFHVVDRRLTDRPPGTREVPGDLEFQLLGLQGLRDDIIAYSADVAPPAEHDRIAASARERAAAAVDTAVLVLDAEKAGDTETSARLRADIDRIAGELKDARDTWTPDTDPAEETG